MNKIEIILWITAISLMVLSGFSITINTFHYEFKGLISIIFKLIYGKDL